MVLGRRSCSMDPDPRFSIDLGRVSIDCGRISIDEVRCSFDAPRASCDGYCTAPVVSVIENDMATVYGSDHQMKVENEGKRDSSCSSPMKDQYLDVASLHRLTKGLDQSNSLNRGVGLTNGTTKVVLTEKELNEWRLNSIKDDSSESFDTASRDLASVSSSSTGTGNSFKKCGQWSKLWSIWGLLHRRKGNKSGNEEKPERGNVECPHADCADTTASNGNEEAGPDPGKKLVGSVRGTMSRTESKVLVRRRQEDLHWSAKFSPNHFDNGLLRFYLTPLRSRRRSNSGKRRLKNSRSSATSVLRL